MGTAMDMLLTIAGADWPLQHACLEGTEDIKGMRLGTREMHVSARSATRSLHGPGQITSSHSATLFFFEMRTRMLIALNVFQDYMGECA